MIHSVWFPFLTWNTVVVSDRFLIFRRTLTKRITQPIRRLLLENQRVNPSCSKRNMESVKLQFESIHIVDTHACSRARICSFVLADHRVHRRHPRHLKRTQPD